MKTLKKIIIENGLDCQGFTEVTIYREGIGKIYRPTRSSLNRIYWLTHPDSEYVKNYRLFKHRNILDDISPTRIVLQYLFLVPVPTKEVDDLIQRQHSRNIAVPVEEKLNSDLKSLSSAILANTSERQCIACEGKGTIGDEECPDCGGKGNYNAKRMWCVANKNYVAFARTALEAQILRDNNPILRYARINEIIQMEPSKIEYNKIYNKQTCPGYYK